MLDIPPGLPIPKQVSIGLPLMHMVRQDKIKSSFNAGQVKQKSELIILCVQYNTMVFPSRTGLEFQELVSDDY